MTLKSRFARWLRSIPSRANGSFVSSDGNVPVRLHSSCKTVPKEESAKLGPKWVSDWHDFEEPRL